jgi:hypothetical protein
MHSYAIHLVNPIYIIYIKPVSHLFGRASYIFYFLLLFFSNILLYFLFPSLQETTCKLFNMSESSSYSSSDHYQPERIFTIITMLPSYKKFENHEMIFISHQLECVRINGVDIDIMLDKDLKQILRSVCIEEFPNLRMEYNRDESEWNVRVDVPSDLVSSEKKVKEIENRLHAEFERICAPARTKQPTDQQKFQHQWRGWTTQKRLEYLLVKHNIPKSVYEEMVAFCKERNVSMIV